MKTKVTNKRKKVTGILIILIAFSAICWDLATVQMATAEKGTFRYANEFDAISMSETQVAIVPSDYEGLSSKRIRTSDLSYTDVENMVRKAIELQGGIKGVIKKGNKVMLKVNLVGGNSPSGQGENTDVRVPKALVKIIHEAMEGDVEIMIAEGTARGNDDLADPSSVWANSGYKALITDPSLKGINFRLVNINQTYNDLREVILDKKGTAAPHNYKYHIHKDELDADVYISVPVLKIHTPGITSALKNQIGTAPAAYYGYNKMGGTSYYKGLVHNVEHRDWTEEEIVDLSAIADIDFVVVDALMCLESHKSYSGNNQVRMNTIVAGVDPVAVDHVCAKLFCLNPADIAHITLAERVGLGTNNPYLIKIKGAAINTVKKKVEKTGSIQGSFGQSNRTWLLSKIFNGTDMANEYIPGEADIEPVGGANDWTEPVYFFDEMIDLISFYNEGKNIVSYAFTYFYSPENKEAELMVGSHEDMIVYLNGAKVYSYSGMRGYNGIGVDSKKVNIKKGENKLLVKTLNTLDDYSFSLNICDYESAEQYAGNRVDGLVFYTAAGGYSSIAENKTEPKLLLRNYPNPVTSSTQIEFELPAAAKTAVYIYDMSGKMISTLANNYFASGIHKLEWTANDQKGRRVKAGMYICTIKTDNFSNSIKILVR